MRLDGEGENRFGGCGLEIKGLENELEVSDGVEMRGWYFSISTSSPRRLGPREQFKMPHLSSFPRCSPGLLHGLDSL